MHIFSIYQYIPVVELVVVDRLHLVAVHQRQNLLEPHPLAVAEVVEKQDMRQLEGVGLPDREGVEHLDRQVVVAHQAAEVEPRLPAVGAEEVDL